jgi:hypothetical protein
MIYELRIYHMHPGKMQAINDRFANFTLGIFAKHGIRVADFWEDIEAENNRICYVLEYDDMESRNRIFNNFLEDPEWKKVKSESEINGPIVSKIESIYLKRVPYLPIH